MGRLYERYTERPDLDWIERLTLYPLAGLAIVLGVYPNLFLKLSTADLTRLLAVLKA
jgi:NADH:ubiquinone oxidoreductase subunit 4 (subunit M)